MKALVKLFSIAFLSTLALSCGAEETASLTLATGVALVEKSAVANNVQDSVILQKAKNGYEVLVHAYMPCQGDFAAPWLALGPKPTLVLGKERSSFGFRNKEECKYRVRVAISRDRLERGGILYIVNEQVVVGHVKVP